LQKIFQSINFFVFIILSALPILTVIILMIAFNIPAKKAIPFGWIAACSVALLVWKQNPVTLAAWAIDGFLEAVSTFAIIFGALMIMNTLKHSGAVVAIQRCFNGINPDRRIQAIIVGFLFEAFLEGAAGFGTPAALAAPLMISLGFPPLCAAIIALIYNSVPVSFGAAGTPTITAISVTLQSAEKFGINSTDYQSGITSITGVGHSFGTLFVILMGIWVMCKMFGPEKKGRDAFTALPFALFTTIVFDIFYILFALFFGPEFPSLLGSIITIPIVVFAATKGFLCPRNKWDFAPEDKWEKSWLSNVKVNIESDHKMSAFMAWLPYIPIALILIATRLNLFGLKELLSSDFFWINVPSIIGKDNISWSWNWGWNPGIIPFLLICIITFFVYRMSEKEAFSSFKDTVKQISGATIALFFGVSMVYVYRNTGMDATMSKSMLYVLAEALSDAAGKAYVAISPLIGVLGSFMSGSNTVSNTLFASLQFQTATFINISPVVIVAIQNIGGAAGNMICVNNVVAVCATTGTEGNEGRIIKINLIPCLILCIITTAAVCLIFL